MMFDPHRWSIAYCRLCERLRAILLEAPWSSFDLIAASIAFWLGLYLLIKPDLFSHFDKVYMMLKQFGDERSWGFMLVAFGAVGLLNVLWFARVSFTLQLLARMGIAFCFSCLALTNLGSDPPPASAIVYAVLALSTLWSVWRTRPRGR